MESFLWKFKNPQYAGVKASLTFEAENCKAFVTLKADLGILPPPPSLHHGYQHEHARVPELQKDFLRPVSQFSTKKCPKYVFAEFCDNITHKIEQMLVFFSTFFIWS